MQENFSHNNTSIDNPTTAQISDAVSPNPKKTVRLYYYTSAKYLESILETSALKVTFLGHSNDPFEFLPSFEFTENKEKTEEWRETWAKILKDAPVRAICFSTKISSSAMWGHYADRHQGICLAYDFPIILSKKFDEYGLSKINYSNKRICYGSLEIGHPIDHFIHSCATTKGIEWKYEQEIRLLLDSHCTYVTKDSMLFSPIEKTFLKGIVLGLKCPLNFHMVNSLFDKYEYSNQTVCRATLSKNDYSIITTRIDETAIFSDMPKNEYENWPQ